MELRTEGLGWFGSIVSREGDDSISFWEQETTFCSRVF